MCGKARHPGRLSARRGVRIALLAFTGAVGAVACRQPPSGVEVTTDSVSVEFVTVSDHPELRLEQDSVTPVIFQQARLLGMCFRVSSGTDTSIWEGTLTLGRQPARDFRADAQLLRAGPNSLCLKKVFKPTRAANTQVCAALRPRGQKRPLLAPLCRPVEVLAIGAKGPMKIGPMRHRLAEISNRLNAATLTEIERELAGLPRWLDRPEASELAGRRDHLAAQAEMDLGGSLPEASALLRQAETAFERVASPTWLAVRLLQAELLSRSGATEEAIKQLRRARERCLTLPCQPTLLPSLQNDFGWHILLRQDAHPKELEEAEAALRLALEDKTAVLETAANRRVNLAYLAVRRGRDPTDELTQVRQLLAPGQIHDSERREQILAWADLVEAQSALAAGDARRALALCRPLSARPLRRDRQILAWAASCTGEAYALQGDLASAEASYERALSGHEHAAGGPLMASIPLGTGQRADDFYRAAYLAARRGAPRRSLAILDRLDALAAETTRSCIDRLKPEARDAYHELRRLYDDQLAGERALAQRAAPDDPEVVPVRTELKDEIQRLAREMKKLCPPAASSGPPAVDVRAVPLPEGVLLLKTSPRGQVSWSFSPQPRGELARQLEELDRLLMDPAKAGEEWLGRLAPLARLLLPADLPRRGGGTLTFALYGVLQAVPLQALPVATPVGERRLADLVTVALHPAAAGSGAPHGAAAGADRPPKALFLVNPTGDLRDRGDPPDPGDADFYRQTFREATVLHRGEARLAALGTADGIELLHFDGHGELDPAFPELSWIKLADGDLTLSRIPELRIPGWLVNLSGCQTGDWPVTADSGRYGLAGVFARQGTTWVIASRHKLDNDLARDFNRAFYPRLAAGAGVPESYGEALAEVRRNHPVAAWSGLLLLAGDREGQSVMPRTPR